MTPIITSKIKILIVDDSLIIQKLLTHYLSNQPDFEVVACCEDPFKASQILSENEIDCMILDLELPKMDGVTFLKKLHRHFDFKTIVLSGLIKNDTELKNKLIGIGAFDALAKPDSKENDEFFRKLFFSIRAKKRPFEDSFNQQSKLILIASSTGSTENIRKLVTAFRSPPTIVIIQHMAANYTSKFAKSINLLTDFEVTEIKNDLQLMKGQVYIAPGNYHVLIKNRFQKFFFELTQDPHVNGVRPSADVTFLHLPKELVPQTDVVILSGMGKDGAQGLAHLSLLGAKTTVESEKTAAIFGMPKAAIETKCVNQVLDFKDILHYLIEMDAYDKAG